MYTGTTQDPASKNAASTPIAEVVERDSGPTGGDNHADAEPRIKGAQASRTRW